MGSRAQVQIFIEDGKSIFLYTHWGAEDIEADVKIALARKWRWDDPEYLARIIYDQILHEDVGETGYGIGLSEHGDIEKLITIDPDKQIVTVEDKYTGVKKSCSFVEFIE